MVMYVIVYSCHVCVCYEISKDKLKLFSIVYCLYSPFDGATEVSKIDVTVSNVRFRLKFLCVIHLINILMVVLRLTTLYNKNNIH